jgi:cell wall-associated NlpC family hydrolase
VIDYFSAPEPRAQLAAEWPKWVGTPFCAHAVVCGHGVDCVHLNAQIYINIGFFFGFSPPPYTLDGGKHAPSSQVTDWLLDSACFRPVMGVPAIGDSLVFRGRGQAHHVGLMVTDTEFIHALERYGVVKTRIKDPLYARALVAIFRPIQP